MDLPHRAALLAFAITVVGAVVFGEVFPFSRFSMYAGLVERTRGAVPVLLVDGEIAVAEDYEAFSGLDPNALQQPAGIPSTMAYRTEEIRRWVGEHPGEAPGEVAAELAFVVLEQHPDGAIDRTVLVVDSGRARRRP